jgi:hypothetical protein
VRGEEGAGIAWGCLQGKELLIGYELGPSDAEPEQVEAVGAEHLHVRFDGFELYLQQQSSVAGYLLHLIDLRPLCRQLRLEIRPNS